MLKPKEGCTRVPRMYYTQRSISQREDERRWASQLRLGSQGTSSYTTGGSCQLCLLAWSARSEDSFNDGLAMNALCKRDMIHDAWVCWSSPGDPGCLAPVQTCWYYLLKRKFFEFGFCQGSSSTYIHFKLIDVRFPKENGAQVWHYYLLYQNIL